MEDVLKESFGKCMKYEIYEECLKKPTKKSLVEFPMETLEEFLKRECERFSEEITGILYECWTYNFL